MPLVAPNLDTRTFEQIVAEVRRRIPTFTPEWTDLNDSDPGITLAQLFAFMSDQLIFQVNQVPNKGLITFLQMVGVELHPAVPALADVTFIPTSGNDVGSPVIIEIDERTQIQTAAPPPGQTTPLTFETTEAFTAINGTVVDLVQSDVGVEYTSVLTANNSATGTFQPFMSAASTADSFYIALQLNVPGGLPWPAAAFRFRVNVADSTAVGEPTNAAAAGTPKHLNWSYSTGTTTVSGSTMVTFAPITPSLDSTLELTQSGYLEFTFPTAGLMQQITAAAVVPANFLNCFVLRAQVASAGVYGASPPNLKSVLLNTVPARNLVTVQNEPLGSSNGRAFQSFTLANAPVYPGSTVLTVFEPSTGGGTFTTWTETLDLFSAGPSDRQYELIPDTGEILFGDGTTGMIPPPDDGSQPAGNIVATSYQYGGGLSGNVGATSLTKVLGSTGTVSFDANNALPATGGDDEEAVSSGVARAPAVVRSRYRAVSLADFEALAIETPTARVARAKALPNTRPQHKANSTPGAVTVILVPNATFASSVFTAIALPDAVKQAVQAYLDQRRLVTAELYTTAAVFRQVTVTASLQVAAGTGAAAALAAAVTALQTYFHALVGGDDGTGWPFGGTIYFSRVFQQLLDVPGVSLVEKVSIALDAATGVSCTDVQINPGELLYSGQHQILVTVAT
jgi:predicted phage baseplate assembly protein